MKIVVAYNDRMSECSSLTHNGSGKYERAAITVQLIYTYTKQQKKKNSVIENENHREQTEHTTNI